jgi:hypothetical protein
MPRGYDVFKKQGADRTFDVPKDAPSGTYSYFGPPDTAERFKFSLIKEEGDLVSLQPGQVKFKKGLTCLRWTAEKGGESQLYVVLKTTPSRIDLKKAGATKSSKRPPKEKS